MADKKNNLNLVIEQIKKQTKDPNAIMRLGDGKKLIKNIDVISSGLDQDSRGRPWETSSMLLGLSDKIIKIYGFCNVCGIEATKTFRKAGGGKRTQVGASDIYEPRCLKHWEPK